MFNVTYMLSFNNVCGRLSEITWQNIFSRCWSEVTLPLCSVPAQTLWRAGFNAGLPGQNRYVISLLHWRESSEELQRLITSWSPWHEQKVEEIAQPGGDQAQDHLISIDSTWLTGGWRNWSWTLLSGLQRQEKRHWAGTEIQSKESSRKTFFTVGVVEPWNGVPREGVEYPSFEIFRTELDTALRSQL